MAINVYNMGLKPNSCLEISLSFQRVSTLPMLLSQAKQYIECEDMLLAKRNSSIEFYPNSQKGKKSHFEKENYYKGESSAGPQRNT